MVVEDAGNFTVVLRLIVGKFSGEKAAACYAAAF